MLDMMVSGGFDIAVAHCNFQLRGEEAMEDEAALIRKCEKYGVPLYNIRFDTQAEMQRTGESVQVAARRLRYTWFEKIRSENGFDKIVIAHNADDSVETFFINLIRGCGIKGLTGISNINGHIVRPLLFAPRRDIVEYAVTHKITYREDSSNSSTKYLRNKLRLGVIPKIREISPVFGATMTANIARLTECLLFISHYLEKLRSRVVSCVGDKIVIDVEQIDEDLPLAFVLRELMLPWGFNASVAESVAHCCNNGESGRRFFSPDYAAYFDRGKVIILPIVGEDMCELFVDSMNGTFVHGNMVFTLRRGDATHLDSVKRSADIALLDVAKIKMPLTIRRWVNGDSFVPFGMSGSKKVSDYLINEKVSLPDKSSQTVVVSDGEIVWLSGHRIDDRYKITDSTEEFLEIRVKPFSVTEEE
jgi:tRNA(Ile)-lysidine synthase